MDVLTLKALVKTIFFFFFFFFFCYLYFSDFFCFVFFIYISGDSSARQILIFSEKNMRILSAANLLDAVRKRKLVNQNMRDFRCQSDMAPAQLQRAPTVRR